jgi:siderophore synthetase component
VYRPGAEVMLKLSLGLRITNSRRNNLRAELELGAQVGRLLDADLAGWLRRHHPSFRVVADPGWVAVEADGPGRESGLETALRAVPFGAPDRVACVAGLLAERPDLPGERPDLPAERPDLAAGGCSATAYPVSMRSAGARPAHTGDGCDADADPTGIGRSALARIVRALATQQRRTVQDTAADWFGRYLDVVAVPVLDLRVRRGLGVEAHHQNTLVTLDPAGWPTAGWYRDSQGWYVSASRADEVRALVPGFGDGLPAVFDDALVDERVTYYLVVNNLFGVVGALGATGLADEGRLLRLLHARLVDLRRNLAAGGSPDPGLLDFLLSAPRLPCKANLATCVDGRDELVGDVASQSVYVTIPNPLAEAGP